MNPNVFLYIRDYFEISVFEMTKEDNCIKVDVGLIQWCVVSFCDIESKMIQCCLPTRNGCL